MHPILPPLIRHRLLPHSKIRLVGLLVLLSACNPSKVAENTSSEATPGKSKPLTPLPTEEDAPSIDWVGIYLFDNDGGEAGKMMLGNELELKIREEGESDLNIFSKSMATPHALLKVTTEAKDEECRILHHSYVKGTGWEELEKGDELLVLRMEEGELVTEWKAWKPLYGELPDVGKYFEKQEQ